MLDELYKKEEFIVKSYLHKMNEHVLSKCLLCLDRIVPVVSSDDDAVRGSVHLGGGDGDRDDVQPRGDDDGGLGDARGGEDQRGGCAAGGDRAGGGAHPRGDDDEDPAKVRSERS
jgi:hypothetical protein